MPKNPLESDIEKATSENLVEDDWVLIFDICSRVTASPSGAKHAFQALVKRLRVANARVQFSALQLFGALSSNCGRPFQQELSSREFYDAVFGLWRKQPQAKVLDRLRELLQEWMVEFQSDSSLAMMHKLCQDLKSEGFPFQENLPAARVSSSGTSSSSRPQPSGQDDELSRAIALSLQESSASAGVSSSSQFSSAPDTSSSIYPALSTSAPLASASSTQSAPARASSSVLFQARALYDFQSQEDNEVSFKAGEIVNVLDNTDENWWSGSTLCGSGLFPASFVTRDLSASPEPEVQSQTAASTTAKSSTPAKAKPEIRETQITLLLDMLHNADATVENEEEDKTLKELETECNDMKPLIADRISDIDGEKATLQDLNQQFHDALAFYQQLMKETVRPAVSGHSTVRESAPPMQAYIDEHSQSMLVHAEADGREVMGSHGNQYAHPYQSQVGAAAATAAAAGDYHHQSAAMPHSHAGPYQTSGPMGAPLGDTVSLSRSPQSAYSYASAQRVAHGQAAQPGPGPVSDQQHWPGQGGYQDPNQSAAAHHPTAMTTGYYPTHLHSQAAPSQLTMPGMSEPSLYHMHAQVGTDASLL